MVLLSTYCIIDIGGEHIRGNRRKSPPCLPKETSIYWIPRGSVQRLREQAHQMMKYSGTQESEAVYSTIIASAGQSSAA